MQITEGFVAKRAHADVNLPPGQHLTRDFPVLSAGPTPLISPSAWRCAITTTDGTRKVIDWEGLHSLPVEDVNADLHCVTRWSKLGTRWRGVPVEALLVSVEDVMATHVMVSSYGGYTTNMPLEDLLDGRAWLVFEYDGQPLAPVHGGPVRLLVPHLYLWKSAKWLSGLTLMTNEKLGFWESLGYHRYGNPWLEQRYSRE